MRTAHGLFIPNQQLVMDMQSFVGYLATEVREWHECLYCGATKPSTESIQSHMRDKGHCLLNLEREPELLEFWEDPAPADDDGAGALEKERPTNLSTTELRFAGGRVIESGHAAQTTKKATRKRTDLMLSTAPTSSPASSEAAEPSQPVGGQQPAPGRQLARREEMGILGVSAQQRQALVLAEKKAQRSEATARRAREWISSRGANSQKFDQLDNRAKWGKQQHKLLPR